MTNMQSTALALEYQGYYGTARRNLNIADLMDNSAANSPIRIFGLGFQEESSNSLFVKTCTLFQNGTNTLLVGLDSTEPLP
jgi:hypothetical protein